MLPYEQEEELKWYTCYFDSKEVSKLREWALTNFWLLYGQAVQLKEYACLRWRRLEFQRPLITPDDSVHKALKIHPSNMWKFGKDALKIQARECVNYFYSLFNYFKLRVRYSCRDWQGGFSIRLDSSMGFFLGAGAAIISHSLAAEPMQWYGGKLENISQRLGALSVIVYFLESLINLVER